MTMTLDDLQGRATISVREAVQVTGFGRDAVYAGIARGEFPGRRLGRTIRVPVPELLAWLGVPHTDSEADPVAPEPATAQIHALIKEQVRDHETARRTG